LPAASKAVATGRGSSVGPGFGEPMIETTAPSGPRNCTRPLMESTTARRPLGSTATPAGVSNWPLPRPERPMERSSVPPLSKTSMRSLPVLVT
jgi:hypothetical protein